MAFFQHTCMYIVLRQVLESVRSQSLYMLVILYHFFVIVCWNMKKTCCQSKEFYILLSFCRLTKQLANQAISHNYIHTIFIFLPVCLFAFSFLLAVCLFGVIVLLGLLMSLWFEVCEFVCMYDCVCVWEAQWTFKYSTIYRLLILLIFTDQTFLDLFVSLGSMVWHVVPRSQLNLTKPPF